MRAVISIGIGRKKARVYLALNQYERSGVPLGFSKYSVPKLRKRPYGYLVEIRAERFRLAELMLRLNA